MRKLYIIIPFVLIILVSIGYLLFSGEDPLWNIAFHVEKDAPATSYAGLVEQNLKKATDDATAYNKALAAGDTALCSKINDTKKQQDCSDMIIADTVRASGVIDDCARIQDADTSMLCRDTIRVDRAIKTQNVLLCAKVEDVARRDNCSETIEASILRAHITARDITQSVCDTFTTDKYRALCVVEIREIDETMLYKSAIEDNNLSRCTLITQKELKNLCTDNIYLKNALTLKDVSSCINIIDLEKQNYCKTQFVKVTDASLYKDAIQTNSKNKCAEISLISLRTKCLDTLIITEVKSTGNTNLCDGLSQSGTVAGCKRITPS